MALLLSAFHLREEFPRSSLLSWDNSLAVYCFLKHLFLCRLLSIATHRDHFVRLSICLSVRLSHFSVTLSKAMFPRNAATIFSID